MTLNVSAPPTRPVVRYLGGKWRLAPWVIAHMPTHRVYVEPYGGGGSVLMRKPRSYAEVYNDTWGDIVNVFRVLRDPVTAAEFRDACELTPWARDEFYACDFLPDDSPVERARKTVFHSFAGHGSAATDVTVKTGFRNALKSNSTPAANWRFYPDAIPALTSRLAGVTIENRPAIQVMRQYDTAETLHYVDPPYVQSTRPSSHYTHEMNDADHTELSAGLHGLSGMVMLSGYDCDLYRNLYSDWRRIQHSTVADGARPRIETMWFNPAAWENTPSRLIS